MPKQAKYHDVMLVPRVSRPRWKSPRGRFYPTGTRQMPDGRIEVTFNLPPSILSQWRAALKTGKRIRLFVPR